ncbi:hypothetical protein V6N13_108536 [Hibiscus sabdariffa]
MTRIRGIEQVNEGSSVQHLHELENKLKDELSEVLKQEEVLWFQWDRTEWINNDDRNTKYYHQIAKASIAITYLFSWSLNKGYGLWGISTKMK